MSRFFAAMKGAAVSERFVTAPDDTAAASPGLPTVLAVLAWHALPEKTRHSETGVRLGLWLGVEARQPDLLAEARAAAQSGLSSNR